MQGATLHSASRCACIRHGRSWVKERVPRKGEIALSVAGGDSLTEGVRAELHVVQQYAGKSDVCRLRVLKGGVVDLSVEEGFERG